MPNVGIGTTAPEFILHVASNTAPLAEIQGASNTPSLNPELVARRSRGTMAAKTAVASGDEVLQFSAWGWDGNSWEPTGLISFSVDGTPGNGDMPGNITFSTTPDGSSSIVERMRIDNAGYVGIGNTAPSRLLHVGSASVSTGTPVANFQNIDGTCTITPASSGSGIACSSDERLKENFQDVTGDFALDRILKLQTVTYNFRTSSDDNRRTGYKAQEVQKVAPEFVRENEDGFLQVYYDAFIPWITEAIKTLYHRIIGLEENQANQTRQIAKVEASKADKTETEALKAENAQLKQENAKIMQENAEIKARLEKIEKALSSK